MVSNVVFDNAVLLSHTAYKRGYGCKLNEISIRDYKTGGFNDKIVSIDLDNYEKSVSPGSQNNTMDAAIGISNLQNNRRVNQRLLLVELRLGYDNADNIKGADLRHKSYHSRSLLGGEINIDPSDYFIFKDRIIQEVKNRINKLALENGCKDKWHSLTVEEFNNLILDAENLPYQPINDPDKIHQEVESCDKNINSLITISSEWLQEARVYLDRYNINETEIICHAVIKSLENILTKNHFEDKEAEWYIEDLISDYNGVLFSANKLRQRS